MKVRGVVSVETHCGASQTVQVRLHPFRMREKVEGASKPKPTAKRQQPKALKGRNLLARGETPGLEATTREVGALKGRNTGSSAIGSGG